MTELRLDLRDLSAPEPMQLILVVLRTLPRGQRLVALTPLRPVPLLPILDDWGFAYRIRDLPAGEVCITICHADDTAVLDLPPAP